MLPSELSDLLSAPRQHTSELRSKIPHEKISHASYFVRKVSGELPDTVISTSTLLASAFGHFGSGKGFVTAQQANHLVYLTHWARRQNAEHAVTHVLVDVPDAEGGQYPHRLVQASAAYMPSSYPSPGSSFTETVWRGMRSEKGAPQLAFLGSKYLDRDRDASAWSRFFVRQMHLNDGEAVVTQACTMSEFNAAFADSF